MTRHPFAPGAIEAHRRPLWLPAQRRKLARWLVLALAMVGAASIVGMVAGLLSGVVS